MKPYYQTELGMLYHGDCFEIIPGLPKVDLVLTDPPYGEKTHEGARATIKEKLITFDYITKEKLINVLSLIKLEGWCILTCEWRFMDAMEKNPPNGMKFIRFGVWVKPNGCPQFTGDRPATGWEAIAILHSPGKNMKWYGGGNKAVWTHNKLQNNVHPTEKPRSLWLNLLQDFGGTTVLDPFAGVGTTAIACEDLRRRWICIEKEEKYCEMAAKRIEAYTRQMRFVF